MSWLRDWLLLGNALGRALLLRAQQAQADTVHESRVARARRLATVAGIRRQQRSAHNRALLAAGQARNVAHAPPLRQLIAVSVAAHRFEVASAKGRRVVDQVGQRTLGAMASARHQVAAGAQSHRSALAQRRTLAGTVQEST